MGRLENKSKTLYSIVNKTTNPCIYSSVLLLEWNNEQCSNYFYIPLLATVSLAHNSDRLDWHSLRIAPTDSCDAERILIDVASKHSTEIGLIRTKHVTQQIAVLISYTRICTYICNERLKTRFYRTRSRLVQLFLCIKCVVDLILRI